MRADRTQDQDSGKQIHKFYLITRGSTIECARCAGDVFFGDNGNRRVRVVKAGALLAR